MNIHDRIRQNKRWRTEDQHHLEIISELQLPSDYYDDDERVEFAPDHSKAEMAMLRDMSGRRDLGVDSGRRDLGVDSVHPPVPRMDRP